LDILVFVSKLDDKLFSQGMKATLFILLRQKDPIKRLRATKLITFSQVLLVEQQLAPFISPGPSISGA